MNSFPQCLDPAAEEQAARARLDLQQRKLPAFPTGLPAEVVSDRKSVV